MTISVQEKMKTKMSLSHLMRQRTMMMKMRMETLMRTNYLILEIIKRNGLAWVVVSVVTKKIHCLL